MTFLQSRFRFSFRFISQFGEFSTWTTLSGGIPQGSWLGPLSFIILVDDLAVGPILHKYVDDTTIPEPLSSTSQTTDIQSHVNSLLMQKTYDLSAQSETT